MTESYTWKITLTDGSVKLENTDKFSLAWEAAGAVREIELVGSVSKSFSCDLTTGVFDMNGTEITVPGTPSGTKQLYYRKRNQVRSDGVQILSARSMLIFGFKATDNHLYLAEVQPEIEQVPETIVNPYKK